MSETATVAKLAHNRYASDIREYLKAKADKKAYDALARQAEDKIKGLKSILFMALDGAQAGKCGNAVINVKPGKIIPGGLTLRDGRKIPLNDIKEIVYVTTAGDPDVITADTVKTWYGGANGSDDLEVVVAGDTI